MRNEARPWRPGFVVANIVSGELMSAIAPALPSVMMQISAIVPAIAPVVSKLMSIATHIPPVAAQLATVVPHLPIAPRSTIAAQFASVAPAIAVVGSEIATVAAKIATVGSKVAPVVAHVTRSLWPHGRLRARDRRSSCGKGHYHSECHQLVAKHREILRRSVGAQLHRRAIRGGRRPPVLYVKGAQY